MEEQKIKILKPSKHPYRIDYLPRNGKRGRPKGDWCTHQEAREWVRRLQLGNYKDWLRFAQEKYTRGPLKGRLKRPRSIPAHPQATYAADWISDSFFLGHVDYLPYTQAKSRVISLGLKSYSHWITWHKENKPWWSPQQPDLVYDNWESWGKFLGTGNINPRDKQKLWRPFDEAVKYIHGYQITSEHEYVDWHKENNPKDLPIHPDKVYKDWQGWSYFLGKSITDKLEAQHIDTRVLAITQHIGYPPNVWKIHIEPKGKSELLAKQREQRFKIFKIYQYEDQFDQHIQQVVMAWASRWHDGNNQFLVQNIHELVFELDSILAWA